MGLAYVYTRSNREPQPTEGGTMQPMKCKVEYGDGITATFYSDKKKVFLYSGGFSARTGSIKLANGKTYRGIIECCDQDSGEHYGSMIWTGSGLLDLHNDKAAMLIGLSKTDIFPYKYKHDTPISGDCHCNVDGWSN